MKKPLLLIGLLAALAVGWFLVSPLFIDRTVDEALPVAAQGPIDAGVLSPSFPSRAEVDAMAPAERDLRMAEVMELAAAMPDHAMDESMPPHAPTVIARGAFRDADAIHQGSGDAALYALPDGSHLVRFEKFRVTNGPALYVYLAEHPDPTEADQVSAGYVSLGQLKGNVGNQNYPIPDDVDVDVSKYGSVVIWCQLFGVLFSPAPLN